MRRRQRIERPDLLERLSGQNLHIEVERKKRSGTPDSFFRALQGNRRLLLQPGFNLSGFGHHDIIQRRCEGSGRFFMNDRAHVVFPPGQGRGPTNPYRVFLFEEVEQSIPARFEQQVAGDPGKIAVGTANQELTYDELNQAANRLALAILELRGAEAEPVAFLLDHGCPQIVAILGILKAGKIYVPLDPSHPQARNAAVLENALPGLLVTDNANRRNADGLKPGACQLLNLDDLGSARNIKDPEVALAPDRPANIIYTSGSTGTVKGLVHSHRNILHTALKYTNNLHISREDRQILLYSCTFAGSVADIFSCLLNGATLLPYDLKVQGITHLGRWLAEKEISLYQSVPTVFRQFVATLSGAERFPHLRLVRLGGEAVTPSDVRLHRKFFPPSSVLAVSFAATEILGIRLYFVDHEMPMSGPRVPVGYRSPRHRSVDSRRKGRAPRTELCRRHSGLQPLPGAWLLARYAEQTQSAFRPDPDRPGGRRFRLGDLGLLRPDGCMEYLGRSDFQVKIRGHRVEVAEVEAALLTLDGIKETVVVGKDSATGGQRLEAYVVAATRPAPTASRLRISLHELLPDYMIPSAFVMLDELPTTASGKIDRLALPTADTARPALSNPYLPARDPLQILLVQIWQDFLNVQPVGVCDDFFELGGDSVLAMDMVLRTEEVCGRPVPEGALLSARTVEQLARLLLMRETNPNTPPMIEVQKGNSARRLFFLHGDFHGGGVYCTFLARHIGRDQAFVAIHPHGLSEAQVPTTIEGMAADRVRLIREYQPHGPYLLGGHCNGGLVAFEIAQQLVRQGERVEYLAIIAPPVNVQVGPPQPSLAPAGIFSFGVGIRPQPAPVDLTGLSYLERRSKLLEIYYDACGQYVMKRYSGELVVVIPQGDLADYGPPQCWEAAASRGQVQFLPGEHLTIVTTSHVRALAKLMQETLTKSQLP